MNWFAKYKYYLLPWVVLLAYLFVADPIYAALFLKNGKPIHEQKEPFVQAGPIKIAVDNLLELNYDGEEMYDLRGWAFSPEITDLKNMETRIVLHSTRENLVFATGIWQRKKLTEVMPQYNIDLENAGYRALISKNALKIDNYQIGILVINKETGDQYFTLTGTYIERTPNHLRFDKGE